jgi:hypothetical protein
MNSIDWKNATPEQINAFRAINPIFAYTTITPLFYEGGLAGSEFLTYAANKFYFALEIEFGIVGVGTNPIYVIFYNQANVQSFSGSNSEYWYNTTAITQNNFGNSWVVKNNMFSRINPVGYAEVKFNGYRLNT